MIYLDVQRKEYIEVKSRIKKPFGISGSAGKIELIGNKGNFWLYFPYFRCQTIKFWNKPTTLHLYDFISLYIECTRIKLRKPIYIYNEHDLFCIHPEVFSERRGGKRQNFSVSALPPPPKKKISKNKNFQIKSGENEGKSCFKIRPVLFWTIVIFLYFNTLLTSLYPQLMIYSRYREAKTFAWSII